MSDCIIVISESGASAAAVSSARPAAIVVAVTSVENTYRQMALLWGVRPVLVEEDHLLNKVSLARYWAKQYGGVESGGRILLVRWFHHDPMKSTPSVTVLSV